MISENNKQNNFIKIINLLQSGKTPLDLIDDRMYNYDSNLVFKAILKINSEEKSV